MVSADDVVARLIPDGTPLTVVSFVPERDRAFLAIGATARIEVDQLPSAEFGAINGRITRIGSDVASAAELREALGDHAQVAGPMVRVELTVTDDAQRQKLLPHLRAGSLVGVRYTLRRRRVITLIVEPLRHFLEDR
jgi:hypothetical protein